MRKILLLLLVILLPALASAQGPSSAQIEAAKGLVKLYTAAGLPATCPPGKRIWDTTANVTKICANDGVTWGSVGTTTPFSCDGVNCTLASGQLLLPAGSAANPSVALGGEQTGLYLSSAGVISYATLGTVRMRMAAGGVYPAATGAIPTGLSGNRWSAGFFGGQTLTTTVTPLWDGSVTWNDSGTTHQGMLLNVTDTASAAASTLIDLKVGGSSKFSVTKAGALTVATTINAGSNITTSGAVQAGASDFFRWSGRTQVSAPANGAVRINNSDNTAGAYIESSEQTTPSAPAADGYRLYAKDNGAGKTQLCVLFSSGAEQCFATQP